MLESLEFCYAVVAAMLSADDIDDPHECAIQYHYAELTPVAAKVNWRQLRDVIVRNTGVKALLHKSLISQNDLIS